MDYMLPIGYKWLTINLSIKAIPHFCESFVTLKGVRRSLVQDDRMIEVYTKAYKPDDTVGSHLEFALKHEGVNPEILKKTFNVVSPQELTIYIKAKPIGSYTRKIWFLYEYLTGRQLDIPNLDRGNYVDLLDPSSYYTAAKIPSQRHRVNNNLLGNAEFCPMVRRTPKLTKFENDDIGKAAQVLVDSYPETLQLRALSQMYTAETKSSFEIEHLSPDANKTERFVTLLKAAGAQAVMSTSELVKLQAAILGSDNRRVATGYRTTQEYVSSIGLTQQTIHLVPPKPEDIDSLMSGLFKSYECMRDSKNPAVHPVIVAAAISFGFVYVHPFKDGNGRIHRYLIHHILARMGFSKPGVIFPVSAVMARRIPQYQKVLNTFSQPLMRFVDYELDAEGHMTVKGETAAYYRYIDMTNIAEGLSDFMRETVEKDFVEELDFLMKYDNALHALKGIADGMSDREYDLFIKFCRQNDWRLSSKKRSEFFPDLSEDEQTRMQDSIKKAFLS